MKMSYFEDTDTLYIELCDCEVAETKDLNANTYLDLDPDGNVIAITVEHASTRADLHKVTLTGIAV